MASHPHKSHDEKKAGKKRSADVMKALLSLNRTILASQKDDDELMSFLQGERQQILSSRRFERERKMEERKRKEREGKGIKILVLPPDGDDRMEVRRVT